MKIFKTKEQAERYADKNHYKDSYIIEETKQGNFIVKKIK